MVLSIQKMISASWPTPTGLGDTEMYACVGKVHGGVCEVTVVNEAIDDIIKIKTINKAEFLFVFICFFSSFLVSTCSK